MRAFNELTIFAESAAAFGPALCDHRLDTSIAQGSPMSLGAISAIGIDHARPLNRVAAQDANRWNRVDQRQQLRDIVDVRASQDRGERCAVGVGDCDAWTQVAHDRWGSGQFLARPNSSNW